MRKIIVQEMLSVDGFFAGPNGELDWHLVDAEFNEFAVGFLDTVDTFLFGRVTYGLMASYWPTDQGIADDSDVADRMNRLAKVVVSRTLENADWNNSSVIHEIVAEDIMRMKEAPGKDIAIFGSGQIVSALARLGLIDEYRLIIAPVVLGKGKPLFTGIDGKFTLKLLETRRFASGNVMLRYGQIDIHS